MSYSHLTARERYVIHHLLIFGLSNREIGRRLCRDHTTIGRELKRNGTIFGPYLYELEEKLAQERRHQARHSKRRYKASPIQRSSYLYTSPSPSPQWGEGA